MRALRGIHPEIDDEPELLLAEREPTDRIFLGVLAAQVERSDRRTALVLDDISKLTSRSVLDGLALLVDRVGHTLRLVMTARIDPALPVARWRSAGWVADVREEHLRLDDDEALEMAATFGLKISDEAVLALNRHAEGWPVGLHLALVSLEAAPDSDQAAGDVAGSDSALPFVSSRIGVNATGLAFNSLDAVERAGDGRTNPMVNPERSPRPASRQGLRPTPNGSSSWTGCNASPAGSWRSTTRSTPRRRRRTTATGRSSTC